MASIKDELRQVQELLDEGTHVNAKNDYGETAVMWAGVSGHSEAVKLLLNSLM